MTIISQNKSEPKKPKLNIILKQLTNDNNRFILGEKNITNILVEAAKKGQNCCILHSLYPYLKQEEVIEFLEKNDLQYEHIDFKNKHDAIRVRWD